ncbi:hypothetical protein [Streptomyces sp.]|nr:hypothetical protein [Streptomyces sp.]HZF88748.1 hypothetical protein [Streptomyces sp.]
MTTIQHGFHGSGLTDEPGTVDRQTVHQNQVDLKPVELAHATRPP